MKKAIPFFLFIIISIHVSAQQAGWQWAKSAGGVFTDGGRAITTDANGNVYATGMFFTPTMNFDTCIIYNPPIPFTTSYYGNVYLVKMDPNGNALWARSFGGASDHDEGTDIACDKFGNVYIMGEYSSNDFIFNGDTLPNWGGADGFICKFDSLGNEMWSISFGGTDADQSRSICTDLDGNVYACGNYLSDTLYFSNDTLYNYIPLTSTFDAFVFKSDSTGTISWIKNLMGESSESAAGISTDSSNSVYVTGSFISNTFIVDSVTLSTTGGYDLYVIKYNSLGSLNWVQTIGGSSLESGDAIDVDVNGDILLGGSFFDDYLILGTDTLQNIAPSSFQILLAKYNNAGNRLWATSAGSETSEHAKSITSDANGNIFVATNFDWNFSFANDSVTSSGAYDMAVLVFDLNGNPSYSAQAGGAYNDNIYDICSSPSGKIYVTGEYYSDPCIFGSTTLNNVDYNDIFIAQLEYPYFVGVNEIINEEPSFILYPNPSNGEFTLKMLDNTFESLVILNPMGQRIFTSEYVLSEQLVQLPQSAKGTFFVIITDHDGNMVTKKLIIQ